MSFATFGQVNTNVLASTGYILAGGQPYLRVTGSGTTLNYTANAPLLFGGPVIQQGGITYNSSNGYWTPTRSGLYHINCNFAVTSATSGAIQLVNITTNVTLARLSQTSTSTTGFWGTIVYPLVAGNNYYLNFNSACTISNASIDTSFTAYQLS